MTKVGMVSLGCSKNQVDAERMLAILTTAGMELETDPSLCDAVIINTCGFIEAAKQESIDNILEFAALKKKSKLKVIVVTGCLAERYKEEITKEMPEADVVLGIGSNQHIVDAIQRGLKGEKVALFGEKEDLSLEGPRILANDSYFAFLKVAEGCDNRCTYCAIPSIRGPFRSRPIESIVAEAKELSAMGVTELNVVAQDTTRYGDDLYGKLMLPELLRQLCEIDGIRWIRMLYCYPERITDELIAMVAQEDKIVNYFDIPLQHASDLVLKRMNRKTSQAEVNTLLNKIRKAIPDVAIRTTFITGFPGETEKQFEELCQFVEETKFQRMGCFAYSKEDGTPAAKLDGQIDEEVKARRAEVIRDIQMGIDTDFNNRLIAEGKELEILVEGYDDQYEGYYGRSYMDAPEVDYTVYFKSEKEHKAGDYVPVKIDGCIGFDLTGKAD